MKASIVYRSRTGTTRRFAEEMGTYLGTLGVETAVASIGDADPAALPAADVVLLGCWTSGLMVVLQHPDEPWIQFAHAVPNLSGKKVVLFTTYKLLTGSMFGKMRHELAGRVGADTLDLKSRDGHLSDEHRKALAALVAKP